MSAPPKPRPCPTPRKGTLVALYPSASIIGPISCKRWACPTCGPRNARRLRRRIDATNPSRFLTLTLKSDPTKTAEQLLAELRTGWVHLRKRLARRTNLPTLSFVAIVEWTAKGTPHLHVLTTMPYVHQRTLSRLWREITGSSIVDIRRVRSTRTVSAYLTAYLTKSSWMPHRRRKWSASRGYLPPTLPPIPEPGLEIAVWLYNPINPLPLIAQARQAGYITTQLSEDQWAIVTPEQLSSPP